MSVLAVANNKLNQADETLPAKRSTRVKSHPKKNLSSLFEAAKPKDEPKKKKNSVKEIVAKNLTPKKKHQVQADENGKISLPLSPNTKKESRVIYMFRKKSDGKVLIGKTEQACGKRASSYVSAFNNAEKDYGKLPLPRAVRENPNDFEFGVLCKAPEGVDLSELEDAYIEMKKRVSEVFNQRKGGGGAKVTAASPKTKKKSEKVAKNILKDLISPEKKPIVASGAGFKALLSPNTKKSEKVIYVFKNNVTGKRYVGRTFRQLSKRVSEHLHFAKNKKRDASKKPLYQDIRKDPSAFSVGVLYKAPEGSSDVDLGTIEKAFIEHYNSHKSGYNRNL